MSGNRKEKRFSKEQLLKSARYRDRRDLLEALLTAEGSYSLSEVEEKLSGFLRGAQ